MSSTATSPTAAAPLQASPLRLHLALLGYLAALTLAEALTVSLSLVNLGLLLHGLVLMVLLLQAAFSGGQAEQRLYLTLAFAPLIRLVSLSMPLQNVPRLYWYLLVGAPLFLSALLVGRYAGFNRTQMGLTARFWPLQLVFGAVGLGLGYLEYLILRPEPLAAGMTLAQLWQPALILVIFTGALEELIFRGLLQSAFNASLGRLLGLLYVSALFAVLHLGYKSALDMAFVFGVALVFGAFTMLTQSILGATLAHGLTNVSLFLIFPFLLAQPAGTAQELQPAWLPGPPALTSGPLPSSPTSAPAAVIASTAAAPTPVQPAASPTGVPLDRPIDRPLPVASPLLVDDGDPGFEHSGGQRWLTPQGAGGDLVWALSARDQATAVVVWSTVIETCGLYQVEAYVPEEYGTSRALPYQVQHRDGIQPVVADQLAFRGAWFPLGEFWFEAGQLAQVSAYNLTGEDDFSTIVVFDALRWALVQQCP